jgi:hypothetical protein
MMREEAMRLAYADPPYIGQARKHYAHDPRCAEVDHAALVAQLETYDGWALSLSSPSLQQVLALCPSTVRVAAWVKPFAAFKLGVNPAYAWEPVIFRPARRKRSRTEPTVRDWLAASITMRKGLHGAKPEAFCFWLFDLLGMQPADLLEDLFPGTGVVGRTWQQWRGNLWIAERSADAGA